MIDLVTTGWFWIGVGIYVFGMYVAAPTVWGILGAMINDPIEIPEARRPIAPPLFHVLWGVAVVLIVILLVLRGIAMIFDGLARTGHVLAQDLGVEKRTHES
ncbi:MAG: hypothetical protein HY475_01075 [Candidatus Terrybacteria bacterium]|nr:hypothetical protein [Candidatus Terrybacteria bacterium]